MFQFDPLSSYSSGRRQGRHLIKNNMMMMMRLLWYHRLWYACPMLPSSGSILFSFFKIKNQN